jgi:hypothetical protein
MFTDIVKKNFIDYFKDTEFKFVGEGGDPWDEYDCHIATIIFEISDKTRFWKSEGLLSELKPYEGTVYLKLNHAQIEDCGTLNHSETVHYLDDIPTDTMDDFWEYVYEKLDIPIFTSIIDYDIDFE